LAGTTYLSKSCDQQTAFSSPETQTMKTNLGGLILACCLSAGAQAGTYKHITIDGSLADWAGVPVAYARTAPDPTTSVGYKDIYVANDEEYLYIRFSLVASGDPFTSHENIFIDADNNPSTGFGAGGGRVQSEMLIQSGAGYQEKNGGFNEGGINGLGWASGPAAPASEFEVRISRAATYASDGEPVFTSETIAFLLEAEDSSWTPVEFAPSDPGGLSYTFAAPPGVLTSNMALVELGTSSWQVNGAGSDLGGAWLDPLYDDTQAGWSSGQGLFGYTPTPAAYPPLKTALTGGSSTYYFRTRFGWSNQVANVAFVVTNYLSDGAVYYLNGVEVKRVRMPEGAVGFGTSATAAASPLGSVEVFGIKGEALFLGENLLQVETHQSPGTAADMVFGLSLTAAAQFSVQFEDASLPADRTVLAGESTSFSAVVLGSGPLSYQWLKDGAEIPGATDLVFTLPVVLPGDAGSYALRVTNAVSSATTRGAVLTVTGTPVVLTDPSLPVDQTVVEGGSATFTVLASGSAPVSYQWFKGETAIAGATSALYTISPVVASDAGVYHVAVSNPISSTNSRTATLVVQRDQTPPTVASVRGSPNQVIISFSEAVDPATASTAANYSLNAGVTVLNATVNPSNPAEVKLTTSAQTLGNVYALTVLRVQDLFGNPIAGTTPRQFLSTVLIDGGFEDWQTLAPLYSVEYGSPTATNFKDLWVFNDADFLYFRVTTWDPTVLPIWYNNFFFDTDDNPASGYLSWGGAEMLIQGGAGYQEKNGGFNEGAIDGLDWLCVPTTTDTNFEFRVSLAATYANDGLRVFTTNVVSFAFDAENTSYQTVNRLPASGTLRYVLVEPPPTALAPLSISLAGGQVTVTWTGPGTLQSCESLAGGTWIAIAGATSPFTTPASGTQRYFRLAQ
jgi:hypothetical protein